MTGDGGETAELGSGDSGFHQYGAELIADGIVHAVGIMLTIAAGSALLALAAFHTAPAEYAAAVFYVASLLTGLSVSLAYNLWPATPARSMLRRFDHAAIYLLIAATYTPFLLQIEDAALSRATTAAVWGAALVGMAVKLFLPGRFDRLAIAFYLAIGWSGVVMLRPLLGTLRPLTVGLIVAGGIVYSCGVLVFLLKGLRFQNAVWHGFVLAGAGLHLAAVMDCLVVARL
jgi:hemolysin III